MGQRRRFQAKYNISAETPLFSNMLLFVVVVVVCLVCTSCNGWLHQTNVRSYNNLVEIARHKRLHNSLQNKNIHNKITNGNQSFMKNIGFNARSKTVSQLQLSIPNLDEIIYQTEAFANSIASTGMQQTMNSHSFSILMAIPLIYGAGLLTSFSPCVWGLLPLTISYISAAANERQDQQTLLPSIAFAAGLASVFCTLGIIAVSIGSVFGSTSNSLVAINNDIGSWTGLILPILSNAICFTMGLKLLDIIDIPMPSFTFLKNPNGLLGFDIGTTATSKENSPILLDATGRIIVETESSSMQSQKTSEGNALVRTFFLGGSSALVASPCATPVLTSILAFVANTAETTSSSTVASTVIGALLLFSYSLGYSTPLLVVAATSGQVLVRLKQQQPPQNSDTTEAFHIGPIRTFFQRSTVPTLIAPWVTPITGGILLYLGTKGLLTTLLGDPSINGIPIID